MAHDVLGGTFAVNGGDLPGEPGEICYFGPDTLSWTAIGLRGHAALLQWALSGGITAMFADLRWPGWEQAVETVAPGAGILTYPPLWSAESRDRTSLQRKVVPLAELLAFHADQARQLAGTPRGQAVRVEPTD